MGFLCSFGSGVIFGMTIQNYIVFRVLNIYRIEIEMITEKLLCHYFSSSFSSRRLVCISI